MSAQTSQTRQYPTALDLCSGPTPVCTPQIGKTALSLNDNVEADSGHCASQYMIAACFLQRGMDYRVDCLAVNTSRCLGQRSESLLRTTSQILLKRHAAVMKDDLR